jgi:hypothetical protein
MYLFTVLASLKGVLKKRTKWIEVILSNKNFEKFLFDKITSIQKKKLPCTPFVRSTKQ